MIDLINSNIDNVWVMIVAMAFISVQIGYLMLEIGLLRKKNTISTINKNLTGMFIATLTFWTIGYGLSHGGQGGFSGEGGLFDNNFKDIDYRNWLIAYGLCTATCTIASSALAERSFLDTSIYFTFIMSSLIYPVLACWVWGGGWLQEHGFIDHAGAGVVHMTAGFAGMIGTILLGPRVGFFRKKIQSKYSFESARRHYDYEVKKIDELKARLVYMNKKDKIEKKSESLLATYGSHTSGSGSNPDKVSSS